MGQDTGTMEVILIGDKSNMAYIKKSQRKVKEVIQRGVIFYINTSDPDNASELYDKNNSSLNLND